MICRSTYGRVGLTRLRPLGIRCGVCAASGGVLLFSRSCSSCCRCSIEWSNRYVLLASSCVCSMEEEASGGETTG